MSPARKLDQRSQELRGRVALVVMGLLVVALAAWALTTDDGDGRETVSPSADGRDEVPSPTEGDGSSTSAVATPSSPSGPVGSSTTVPGAVTTAPPVGCDAPAAVGAWPLRRRLAALVVVGVDPSDAADATAVVTEHHVGGVFVGGDATGLFTSGALQELRTDEPTGLVVSVDEEGGRVERIEGLDGEVPSAREMAGNMTVDEVRTLAERRGRVMAAHGVTVDLAPVVDVSDQPDDTVIGDRSWSDDPAVVTAYARAYAEGLLAAGVAPVLKHFPGHGEATGDSHEGAVSTPPLADLRARDLRPYADLLPELGVRAAVMLGHLDVPGLTEPGTPTSLSPATVALLRGEYGFEGVVMTDDLGAMASITDRLDPADAAVAALAAGVDMVLFSGIDVDGLLDRLDRAVADGELDEAGVDAAVVRTLAWKGIDPCSVTL